MMTFIAAKHACLAIFLVAASTVAEPPHQPPEGLPMMAREVTALAGSHPQRVRDALRAGLRACLPEDARARLSSEAVQKLLVDLHLVYFELASRGLPEPERRRQVDSAVETSKGGLSDEERQALQVLRLESLEQGVSLSCIAATAIGMLETRSRP
ncbi:MAG: hypothetical protein ACK4N1_11795 [Pseudorhizobium sp.]